MRTAPMKQKITPNGAGIRGMSGKGEVARAAKNPVTRHPEGVVGSQTPLLHRSNL
jgi:hypothetical protein